MTSLLANYTVALAAGTARLAGFRAPAMATSRRTPGSNTRRPRDRP